MNSLESKKNETYINLLKCEIETEDKRRRIIENKIINFIQILTVLITIFTIFSPFNNFLASFFKNLYFSITFLILFIISFLFTIGFYTCALIIGLSTLKPKPYPRIDPLPLIDEIEQKKTKKAIDETLVSELNELLSKKLEYNNIKLARVNLCYIFIIIGLGFMVFTIIILTTSSILIILGA